MIAEGITYVSLSEFAGTFGETIVREAPACGLPTNAHPEEHTDEVNAELAALWLAGFAAAMKHGRGDIAGPVKPVGLALAARRYWPEPALCGRLSAAYLDAGLTVSADEIAAAYQRGCDV